MTTHARSRRKNVFMEPPGGGEITSRTAVIDIGHFDRRRPGLKSTPDKGLVCRPHGALARAAHAPSASHDNGFTQLSPAMAPAQEKKGRSESLPGAVGK